MPQPLFLDFSCLLVKDRYLLKTRMKITAYNQHDLGSFSSLGLFACKPTLLAAPSQRRYAIKRSKNFAREVLMEAKDPDDAETEK